MSMKGIAILTHYHKSVNYGGVLQAYALCHAVETLGYHAEQVRVSYYGRGCRNLLVEGTFKYTLKRILRPFLKPLRNALRKKRGRGSDGLQKVFLHFREELIPHSEREYSMTDISESIKEYDAFIVGSDQIWNPIWYYAPFFLTFAPSSVPKIAYAASIAQNSLPEKVRALYRENLKDFRAVSVREVDAVELLSDISPVEVKHVLDPTLLLSAEEWDAVAAPRSVEREYVFCYFLGNNRHIRELAEEYARAKGLILVNAMHAAGLYHENDLNFGDVQRTDLSPEEFLSLIKHASYVFTDSFHATVFSLLYGREFCTFRREGHAAMSSRIYTLTELFGLPKRFLDTEEKETLSYIEALSPVDCERELSKFNAVKTASLAFLSENLQKACGSAE